MVYYTTYVVHTKIFFWDFGNDSYAQNSEIILTIRIQKNFFKIPIGKFFEKLSKSKKKEFVCTTYVVYYTTFVGQSYHICGILYHICGILYHKLYSPEIPILFKEKTLSFVCGYFYGFQNPNLHVLAWLQGWPIVSGSCPIAVD